MLKFDIQNRRYVGSKFKLKDWLKKNILSNTKGDVFLDVFSGTGIISQIFSKEYNKIVINDFLFSNNIIYKAFFEQMPFDEKKIIKIIEKFNGIDSSNLEDNYFNLMFGNKFFGENDSKKIGYIREEIEKMYKISKITEKEYNILLASLIYSTDKIANTVGHYDAYIKKSITDNRFTCGMINPLILKDKEIEIYRKDSNQLIREVAVDVAFIDPPYNSRQYSRFYHILENLTKWEKPELFGVALKPKEENMSGYCKVEAPKLFKDLVSNLKAKYICVTYNNTYNSKSSSSKNKITFEEIKEILNEIGETKILETDYKFFNSGKTNFDNHKEFLFITEVSNAESN
ncbi:MAG: DNA adenine methylase [Cetobacterium sp.]